MKNKPVFIFMLCFIAGLLSTLIADQIHQGLGLVVCFTLFVVLVVIVGGDEDDE